MNRVLFAVSSLAIFAGAVHAQPFINAFSGGVGNATLNLTTNQGSLQITDVDNGWWSATYVNYGGNTNYFVGTPDSGADWLNDFFAFNLAGQLANGQTVTGASISIFDTGDDGTPPFDLSLWDVTTPFATLENTSGTSAAIYNDLGSGIEYGSLSYGGGAPDTFTVTLNAAAVAAINGAANSDSGDFAIGGSLSPSSGVPDAAATWTLLALAAGALFGASRLQRREA